MKKYFPIKLLIVFIVFFNFTIEAFNAEPIILKADRKIGRYSDIYANHVYVRFKEGYLPSQISLISLKDNSILSYEPLLRYEDSYTHNISLYNGISSNQKKNIDKILEAEQPLLRTVIIEYKGDKIPEKFCKELIENYPFIELAEPVSVDYLLGVPNDPLASSQKTLRNIKAFEAWDYFQGDTSVIIGISDIGVNQEHEDLKFNIAPNWNDPINGKDDDGNGYVDDYRGCNMTYREDNSTAANTYHSNDHGTNVAGIAGASTNNGLGIAGVGYTCRIFPIKIVPKNSTSLLYSYKSIIYAALRGCKVLNCSWGTDKRPSGIDVTIINFAISRDVAIVAAGGNKGITSVYYPAGYEGVLGVGEVDVNDQITSTSNYGTHVRILAPGRGNKSTVNQADSYDSSFSGTSSATPIVAGAVAFVRAKYPYLNAVQALEFTRICTDDVNDKNPFHSNLLPGRVNMLKAATTDPYSVPSIVPIKYSTRFLSGQITDRLTRGDTALMTIEARNYLGKANNLKFVLSLADEDLNAIRVLDSVVIIPQIEQGPDTYFNIGDFKITVNKSVNNKMFFRVDIYGENEYKDHFLLQFTPNSEIATFENDAIMFSVGDRGTFGFAGEIIENQGVGFVYKGKGNQIWKAGLMATESSSSAVSALWGYTDGSDFNTVKPFAEPNRNNGIVDDSKSYVNQRIGIGIEQTILVPPGNECLARIHVKVTNNNSYSLSDVSVGYFFDWDIGYDSDSNKVRFFPEAIPESFKETATAAEVAEYTGGNYPVFGIAVHHPENIYKPQVAGLQSPGNLSRDEQIAVLNSGTTLQFSEIDDIAMTAGMLFPGALKPGESKWFWAFIGCGETKEELANRFKAAIINSSVESEIIVDKNSQITIFPNPVIDIAILKLNENYYENISLELIDYLGRKLPQFSYEKPNYSGNFLNLDFRFIPNGFYFIKIVNGNRILNQPVIKISN